MDYAEMEPWQRAAAEQNVSVVLDLVSDSVDVVAGFLRDKGPDVPRYVMPGNVGVRLEGIPEDGLRLVAALCIRLLAEDHLVHEGEWERLPLMGGEPDGVR